MPKTGKEKPENGRKRVEPEVTLAEHESKGSNPKLLLQSSLFLLSLIEFRKSGLPGENGS